MFKFIFDLVTESLGLPIEWYYEWIILGVIGYIAYLIAYDKVGNLYHGDFISGRASGSFFHWIIRTIFYFHSSNNSDFIFQQTLNDIILF